MYKSQLFQMLVPFKVFTNFTVTLKCDTFYQVVIDNEVLTVNRIWEGWYHPPNRKKIREKNGKCNQDDFL